MPHANSNALEKVHIMRTLDQEKPYFRPNTTQKGIFQKKTIAFWGQFLVLRFFGIVNWKNRLYNPA